MSSPVINTLSQAARINSLERVEIPKAALTLTRTAVQSITTAGAAISWQTAPRSMGISWATTDITIPTSGYYMIQVHLLTSVNVTSAMTLTVGGTVVDTMSVISTARTGHSGSALRYFTTADVFRVNFTPSLNCDISLVAYGSNGESPFLHVVQLTGVVP